MDVEKLLLFSILLITKTANGYLHINILVMISCHVASWKPPVVSDIISNCGPHWLLECQKSPLNKKEESNCFPEKY